MPIESATLSTQRASSPLPEPSGKMVCLSKEGAAANSPGRPSWPLCAASWLPSWPVWGACMGNFLCHSSDSCCKEFSIFNILIFPWNVSCFNSAAHTGPTLWLAPPCNIPPLLHGSQLLGVIVPSNDLLPNLRCAQPPIPRGTAVWNHGCMALKVYPRCLCLPSILPCPSPPPPHLLFFHSGKVWAKGGGPCGCLRRKLQDGNDLADRHPRFNPGR